jgi:hypothetical protein
MVPVTSASELSRAIQALCPNCGLCCNGVLFADVLLDPGDPPDQLKSLGLPISRRGGTCRFPQPCAALHPDGVCTIYEQRPARCRRFECGLLKDVVSGHSSVAGARIVIRRARALAQKVGALLEESGNHERHRPLTRRFQAVMNQPMDLAADAGAGDRRGRLMLTVNELMTLVQQRFLRPDSRDPES